MTKAEAYEFMLRQPLAVIATVTPDASPEAAAIEFAPTANLELIFDTFKSSRKFSNFSGNQNVAFVIGWDENRTIQYEGVATEITADELSVLKAVYFAKNPAARKWEDAPDLAYVKVTPKWIRYTDLNQHPWLVEEISL